MKEIGRQFSRRWGYDGWALKVKGAMRPLPWTFCTTREECREVRAEYADLLRHDIEIVKVKANLEAV